MMPIIGIGASAGGLEALEQFLSHVRPRCGAGFVVIQHLDPTHQGILPELLQRITPMKVVQAEEGVKVKADCVYVIPSNKNLSILQGKLHLLDPDAPRGFRLPIDFFFHALATDQRDKAIGIILSGMGSDGTLGVRAIKENGGLVLVQSPDSAKFDAMPNSAINAGLADIVADPDRLWEAIAARLENKHSGVRIINEPLPPLKSRGILEQIITLLRTRTGNDFSVYKKNTLYRRIERRMGLHQIDTIAHYLLYLQENSQEQELLFQELLIGVTQFFRDALVWEELTAQTIPALLAQYPAGKKLRAWVAACSTGEEAYSLAMAFKEALIAGGSRQFFELQIFATDLDGNAIDKARQGFYPATIAAEVSPERLKQFFVAQPGGYSIKKDLREMVVFAQQNVIMDPPFTKLDFLCCRNLLIYLDSECQRKLIRLFHYALNENGVLLLGNAETIGNFSEFFEPIDNRLRLYRRINQTLSIAELEFPGKYFPGEIMVNPDKTISKPVFNLQAQIEQLLLLRYSPPAVLINPDGDILYIHGRTGKYLEPASGKANLNVHAMAREGLNHRLSPAIRQARKQSEAVLLSDLTVGTNGGTQRINVTVQAITAPEELKGMVLLVFTDLAPLKVGKGVPDSASTKVQPILDELQKARAENQSLREEAQSSHEELKSSNEELQSANEELQSANEELTTSKEEMESLNEELQTINVELQAKLVDLSWVNNDMKNLLDSMEIATIFLDEALNVRRFTSHATQLFKLIASDLGRPLSDIVTKLDYPELYQDAQKVFHTLVFMEKRIKTSDDLWFKVRIIPYHSQDNVIDGVVITFIDISETKKLEAQLKAEKTLKKT